MNNFKLWLDNATAEEVDKLARLTKTSNAYIRHLALGRRNASADMAARVQNGLNKMGYDGVTRGDLNKACGECPYYKSCQK